jgi:D-amino-acid dehydrogenase
MIHLRSVKHTMSRKLIVIGGGIVGLSTALYASRRGWSVTVVDRRDSLHEGASFGNAGLVTPSHFIPLAAPGTLRLAFKWMLNPEGPFYVRPRLDRELIGWGWRFARAATATHVARTAPLLGQLLLESHRAFEELAAEWNNDFGFVRRGVLMVCRTPAALHHEAEAAARGREIGIPGEVLDPRALAELEPDVRMKVAGAVLYPQDSHLSPNLFMKSIRARLEESGVELLWGTGVTGWKLTRGEVTAVETTEGELHADEYVICGGAWSPQIAKELGLRLPLQGGKGYSLTLPHPRQKPSRPMILMEARVAITPIGESLRVGGTMEIAGMDEKLNPARIRGIMKSLPMYFEDFGPADFAGVEPWWGFRPVTPDGLPYIGRLTKFANLTVATGHAMMGVSLAPVTGKLVSELLDHRPVSIGIERLSPERYAR